MEPLAAFVEKSSARMTGGDSTAAVQAMPEGAAELWALRPAAVLVLRGVLAGRRGGPGEAGAEELSRFAGRQGAAAGEERDRRQWRKRESVGDRCRGERTDLGSVRGQEVAPVAELLSRELRTEEAGGE